MKFCLSIEIQEGMSYADTLAMARTAEDAGFDTALLAEHYFPSSGQIDRMSDAWVFLGALARDTIRLGSLVSPVTFRHPSVLAKIAASLDHVSEGRAELAMGAGWQVSEHTAYGFDFPPGPERVDILEEQIQVVKGLWTQDPFSHDGPRYHLQGCHFTPRPVQQPHPTLLLGGRLTARRIPRLAARYADEYDVILATPEQCREVRARLDRACEVVGRDPASIVFSIFTGVCVGENDAEVQRRLQVLKDRDARCLPELQAWVMGTPEQAAERLRQLGDAGIQRAMLSVECDTHREMLPLIGERIAPLVG